jgi:hypothetical protein
LSVALDANATAPTLGSAITTLDNGNLTVGAGANIVLVAQIACNNTSMAVSSMVWDPGGANQALTKIVAASGGNSDRVELWGLLAPVSGNKILRATWSPSCNAQLNASSFSGAGGFEGAVVNTGVGTSSSLSVPSLAGNIVMDCIRVQSGGLATPTQTRLFLQSGVSGASYAAGASTVTFGWALASGDWIEIGCEIVAVEIIEALVAQGAALASTGVIGRSSSRT